MSNLYFDETIQREVVTNSAIKTFLRCPYQYHLKQNRRLKPVVLGKPLKRGSWMHELIEEHHKGNDWRIRHRELTKQYANLLDEERDYYGNLPTECAALMRGYEYFYEDDPWTVLETEYTIETELPNGVLYRGRVDMLIENQFGMFIVDHKTHKTLPNTNFRILDSQSALYLWACLRNKIPVKGFIWNYLKTSPPSIPRAVKKGDRLYSNLGDTDYHTFVLTVKQLVRDGQLKAITPEIKAKALQLKAIKYIPGEPSLSPFYRRNILEKDTEMLRTVAASALHTTNRIMEYDFSRERRVERADSRSCDFDCSYQALCITELSGGNTQYMLKNQFRVGDPQDYYKDKREYEKAE